ncbi:hypothetical protein DACRYDRAFT_105440 [Dacryopinax primogenitus]|uniref:Uncharacterized protein n=1 Tax=Dacryopinax primogenitus (strain DJM 731) TaxID=1858805 RepID=M5G2E5_DACPD|nr:uncharacterized protein DACRYDRAFT_105440 [Dacryopinax primogenitus]EJU04381.1 hypothetical protein DACRYDRAFT_105440 [Dacryopinax primogenitus]
MATKRQSNVLNADIDTVQKWKRNHLDISNEVLPDQPNVDEEDDVKEVDSLACAKESCEEILLKAGFDAAMQLWFTSI